MTRLTRKPFQHAINATEYYGWRARRNSSCTLCVNSSSKYPQSEMGACLTRSDYKESHSTMKDCREPSRSLVVPLLLLNPDWGDFELSLCICWYFTSPLSSSFFRIMEENMKSVLHERLAIS